MAKIYDNRPADWDDKDESGAKSQSSVSEYKSGKVQKNVVNDNSIVQEDYAGSQKKKLLSSSEVRETSKGNITTTYEDDTKLTQQSKTAKESYHSNDFKSEIKKETIVTKTANRTESIIVDSTTISTNKLTETSPGKHAITATKNINIKSNVAKISAEKLDVKGASFGMSAKNHTEKAPFKHVKAGDVKYNVSEKLMMDADISKSSFKLQNYQTKQAEYKHPDDVADDVYYIGEVIYSPKLSKLYFVPTNLVREVFNSQQKYLNKSKTNSVYKYNYGKRQVANRFDTSPDLEQVLLSNRDYIHISFVRASMCMLDQSVVSNPNIVALDFSKAKLDGNTSLINWGAINSDLDSKVKGLGYKAGYKFANQDAVDDGVKYLQSLSESNINRWLDIGKTYQASLLYMGLLVAGRYNFKQISEKQARLPYKPDVIADIDYDNETAIAYKSYQHEIDEDYGVFDLVTTEEYVDSEILLSQTVKVAIKGNKYTLEGDNHSRYSGDKDNQIKDGLLLWSRTVSTKHDKKIEKLNLGRLKIKDLESKQLTKPYQIDYKDDKWLVYADSKYLLSTHNHDLDYPTGDALIFEASVDEHYILEKFYYYQLARANFDLDDELVSKGVAEKLERRCLYQMLVDTYDVPADSKIKEYLKSLQENNQTKNVVNAYSEILQASDELFLALPPSAIGKLLYLLINVDWSKADDQDGEAGARFLVFQAMQVALKLLSTLSTKKAYLEALESYQPLTEYNKMNAQEAIDAIWHDKNSILYFEDYGKNAKTPEDVYNVSRSYADIYGAYKYLNSEQMELKDKESDFAKHGFSKFPIVDYVSERDAEKIEKQLKTGEPIWDNGNPSTKVTLDSKPIPIQPCYVPPYLITGTIALIGELTVKDTTSTLQQTELTATRKGEVQAKAKTDLANALGTLSIEKALPKESPLTMSFESKLGGYNIKVNSRSVGAEGIIHITGSISNEQSLVDKNIDGQEIKGTLSLDFDLNLKVMTQPEAIAYGKLFKQVFSTVAISAVSAAAITAAPILVAAGASSAATGVTAIGTSVVAVASSLEGLFLTTANA